MSHFRFRLNTLLRLRDTHRDERRGELADAYRVDDVLRAEGAEVDAELAANRRSLALEPGEIDVDALLAAQRYELVLRQRLAAIDAQRKIVAAEIDRRRLALVEADRDVKVLERLRERDRSRFQQQQDRREAARLDETALTRWMREVRA